MTLRRSPREFRDMSLILGMPSLLDTSTTVHHFPSCIASIAGIPPLETNR
jgi:hypothetical protein